MNKFKGVEAVSRAPWLPCEDEYLRKHYRSAASIDQLVTALERSRTAIWTRARVLGIRRRPLHPKPPRHTPIAPAELARREALRRAVHVSYRIDAPEKIAAAVGVSRNAVIGVAYRLGLCTPRGQPHK